MNKQTNKQKNNHNALKMIRHASSQCPKKNFERTAEKSGEVLPLFITLKDSTESLAPWGNQ